MLRKILKWTFIIGLVVALLGGAAGGVAGFYFYHRLTRDLPKIERLGDYKPKAVTSVHADDGTLIGEFYDERRYPVSWDEIPVKVRQAFLAAEDANFYQHPGVDFISILRALWVNWLNKASKQGASTITQQVVKSLLLSREKTYERKAKEAILAYRLEQALSKDEIFTIYLNEIFLGNTAYGIRSAGKVHFHKELKDLTLAEIAFIAGLPPKPSFLANPRNRGEAIGRQHYVLNQMLQHGYITAQEKLEAERQELVIYPPEGRKIFAAPYFVSHVERLLEEQFGKRYLAPGGLKISTTVDLKASELAERALRRGIREIDKRRGWKGPLEIAKKDQVKDLLDPRAFSNRGGIKSGVIYRAIVREVRSAGILVQVGEQSGMIDPKRSSWAQKLLDKNDRSTQINLSQYIKPGFVIEVALDDEKNVPGEKETWFKIDQTPELEGAFMLENPLTGEVKVIIGGYDYERSVFNRATQGLRQPGSSFKPFVYLSALDALHYTPVTLVPDTPISLLAGNGQLWTPQNFDHKYLGPITFRVALQRSRNVVSVYMTQKLGVDRVIETARKLGITTPIGRDLSISLGTPEVKMSEMVRAYGVFAAGGWLADQIVIKQITDREGKIVFEKKPAQKQVISEESAFIMAHVMKGVIDNGTATILRALKRPIAGKTGTTNDLMDAWFIGYTPEWSAAVWVGFDVKRTIGRLETGGKAAAPIYLYFMEEFLKNSPPLDFIIPDGVVPVTINPATGHVVDPDSPGAFVEYFKSGTEPSYSAPAPVTEPDVGEPAPDSDQGSAEDEATPDAPPAGE